MSPKSNAPSNKDYTNSSGEGHSKKNILLGTLLGYLSLALSIVSGIFYTPWLISSIGKSDYGLYTLCLSMINFFLFDFGLSSTINTYLSKLRAKDDIAGIQKFLGLITKLYLVIDCLLLAAFITVYFLIDYLYLGLTLSERDSLKNVFLISASFSLISFPATVLNGVLDSYEEFVLEKIIDILNKCFYIAFTAVAIVFKWGLLSLVLINSSIGLFCILLKYIYVKSKLKIVFNFRDKATRDVIKTILLFSFWSAVQSLCTRLVLNITPSILGIVSDTDNISLFSIVTSIEGYVYTFGSIMGGFFLPKIARIKEAEKANPTGGEKLQDLAIKVGKLQYVILALAEVGFVCCGKEFLLLWMKDPAFLPGYYGVIVIIFSQLITVPELVYFSSMFIEGHVKELGIISIVKASINIALSFLLSWFYGALGACIAIGISRLIEAILQNLSYKQCLKVNLVEFFAKVYLTPSIPVLICLAVGLTEHFLLPFSRFVNFLIIMGSVGILYSLLAFFISFSKVDRSFVRSLFLKKR